MFQKDAVWFLDKKTKPYKRQKNKNLALRLGIQTYQILTNDDEVCIPSLSSIILAVLASDGSVIHFLSCLVTFQKIIQEIQIM